MVLVLVFGVFFLCHIGLEGVLATDSLPRVLNRRNADGSFVLVDSTGRQRIFHGTNAVVKGPPWLPDSHHFSSDISMSAKDFEWMTYLGLNLLRLGVMWPGVEPQRGEYNETYLDEIEKILDLAAEHQVYVILDMHQDGISEYFCGEGLPTWAVKHTNRTWIDALEDLVFHGASFPSPFSHFKRSDYYKETRLPGEPTLPKRQACRDHREGPGWHELTKESSDVYQALYKNVDGVLDSMAAMWAKVASRFAHRPEVLGLELMNEPFAGDVFSHPLLLVPFPNPENADRANLQPAWDRINTAVRAVAPDVLIFFDGVTFDDAGAGFSAPPGGPDFANRSVLGFHYYSPPQLSMSIQLEAQRRAAQRIGVPSFLTEMEAFGSAHFLGDGGPQSDAIDAGHQSWVGWEWKSFCRRAGWFSQSQLGAYGACKTGMGQDWIDGAPTARFQAGHARTYARAVAGEILDISSNSRARTYSLLYRKIRQDVADPTEIFYWPARFPAGVTVSAKASKGEVAVEMVGDNLIHIRHSEDVPVGANITVDIVPTLSNEAEAKPEPKLAVLV